MCFRSLWGVRQEEFSRLCTHVPTELDSVYVCRTGSVQQEQVWHLIRLHKREEDHYHCCHENSQKWGTTNNFKTCSSLDCVVRSDIKKNNNVWGASFSVLVCPRVGVSGHFCRQALSAAADLCWVTLYIASRHPSCYNKLSVSLQASSLNWETTAQHLCSYYIPEWTGAALA